MTNDEASEVGAAATAIRRRWNGRPSAALVLGTGLHQVSSLIHAEAVIPYAEVPCFPRSTALGHCGQLVCGRLADRAVMVLDGRCHAYEGYPLAALRLPIFAIRELGAELLILSNASGGLNPDLASGDIVVVSDHINLMFWKQPSRLAVDARCGADSVAACGRQVCVPAYDSALRDQALEIAGRECFAACRGVYVAVTGPNYETRAEYRFLRQIGADVVGMSTVPEAVAAARCGLRTLALSIVTNVARPSCPEVVRAETSSAPPSVRSPTCEKSWPKWWPIPGLPRQPKGSDVQNSILADGKSSHVDRPCSAKIEFCTSEPRSRAHQFSAERRLHDRIIQHDHGPDANRQAHETARRKAGDHRQDRRRHGEAVAGQAFHLQSTQQDHDADNDSDDRRDDAQTPGERLDHLNHLRLLGRDVGRDGPRVRTYSRQVHGEPDGLSEKTQNRRHDQTDRRPLDFALRHRIRPWAAVTAAAESGLVGVVCVETHGQGLRGFG